MSSNPLNIKKNIFALSLLGFIGAAITLGLFYTNISSALHAERRNEAQRLIEAATGGLHYFYQLEQSGKISREEAQHQAAKAIGSLRFGESGYFWINDMDGIVIMHPILPDLIGTNLLNTTDNQGVYLFRDFVNMADQGGGWVTYNWPKPGDSENWYSKVSYASPFQPWQWILGTGLYLDDINREINRKTIHLGIITLSIYVIILICSLIVANRYMRKLGNIAIRDALTTMFTRRYLDELSPMFISRHERNPEDYLIVTFFDIDHFKDINDRYGHGTGDIVLKNVGQCISASTRESDLAIRYGGEEFVMISLLSTAGDAIDQAERIREKCAELSFSYKNQKFSITLSAGLAMRQADESMESLIRRADEQLYRAKNRGRDRLESDYESSRSTPPIK